jgi:hypothetical protein
MRTKARKFERKIIGDRRAHDAPADDHDLGQVALTDIGFVDGSAE